MAAAPEVIASADQSFPYRYDNDLFYFTGYTGRDLALVVYPDRRPLVIAKPSDTHKQIWDTAEERPKAVAHRIGAELILEENMDKAALEAIAGREAAFLQLRSNGLGARLADKVLKTAPHTRGKLPAGVFAADMITTPLRLIKDASEISGIKAAAKLTEDGLNTALQFMGPGVSEAQLAAAFEFRVKYHGGELAFESIVAGGPNAAVLHHRAGKRKLKADELVLFDIGARLGGLCGDLSRTFPVSGCFSKLQAAHYDAVLSAQKSVLKFIRAGRTLLEVNAHAETALLDEALKIGLLKGSRSKLLKSKAIKKYYPHSIGHSLGLDVHDPQRYPGLKNLILEPGMVLTVEPGIYLRDKVGRFSPSGVRIEDDIEVTKSGIKFLTNFPREREELERLLEVI